MKKSYASRKTLVSLRGSLTQTLCWFSRTVESNYCSPLKRPYLLLLLLQNNNPPQKVVGLLSPGSRSACKTHPGRMPSSRPSVPKAVQEFACSAGIWWLKRPPSGRCRNHKFLEPQPTQTPKITRPAIHSFTTLGLHSMKPAV